MKTKRIESNGPQFSDAMNGCEVRCEVRTETVYWQSGTYRTCEVAYYPDFATYTEEQHPGLLAEALAS